MPLPSPIVHLSTGEAWEKLKSAASQTRKIFVIFKQDMNPELLRHKNAEINNFKVNLPILSGTSNGLYETMAELTQAVSSACKLYEHVGKVLNSLSNTISNRGDLKKKDHKDVDCEQSRSPDRHRRRRRRSHRRRRRRDDSDTSSNDSEMDEHGVRENKKKGDAKASLPFRKRHRRDIADTEEEEEDDTDAETKKNSNKSTRPKRKRRSNSEEYIL